LPHQSLYPSASSVASARPLRRRRRSRPDRLLVICQICQWVLAIYLYPFDSICVYLQSNIYLDWIDLNRLYTNDTERVNTKRQTSWEEFVIRWQTSDSVQEPGKLMLTLRLLGCWVSFVAEVSWVYVLKAVGLTITAVQPFLNHAIQASSYDFAERWTQKRCTSQIFPCCAQVTHRSVSPQGKWNSPDATLPRHCGQLFAGDRDWIMPHAHVVLRLQPGPKLYCRNSSCRKNHSHMIPILARMMISMNKFVGYVRCNETTNG